MDYLQKLKYHYRPKKGWINDPNGLVYFNGYYHVFYQHAPNHEIPWKEPMHWGHARTKDFLNWEELPVALYPDKPYDKNGCWSGTAIVKDGTLYLFYASILLTDDEDGSIQSISVAYSKDGVNFEKYEGNPVIPHYPPDGGYAFRDPAVCCVDGIYYCVVATGHKESKTGRLLLYKSRDLFNWEYKGIMAEWQGCRYTECPSFMQTENGFLLSASVCPFKSRHYFSLMLGSLNDDGSFDIVSSAEVDKGPDQYAGQIFKDHKGRCILMSWVPGWSYQGFAERDIGVMSLPREITVKDGVLCGYPIEELRHLLKDEDEAVKRTENGFIIERNGRPPVVYEGEISDLKLLRDGYLLEVYVNGGKEVYTVIL